MITKGYVYLLSDASAPGYVPTDRLDGYSVRQITEISCRVPMVTKSMHSGAPTSGSGYVAIQQRPSRLLLSSPPHKPDCLLNDGAKLPSHLACIEHYIILKPLLPGISIWPLSREYMTLTSSLRHSRMPHYFLSVVLFIYICQTRSTSALVRPRPTYRKSTDAYGL